jgi:hypothetical protein
MQVIRHDFCLYDVPGNAVILTVVESGGAMRTFGLVIAAFAVGLAVGPSALAEPKKSQPQVLRSASGTVIQPTRTIIHNPNGTTTVIVQRRSYLDPGTEVPVGYPGRTDYAFPPGGDPGRPYWYFGPDQSGVGGVTLAPWFHLPGINPPNGP